MAVFGIIVQAIKPQYIRKSTKPENQTIKLEYRMKY